MREHRLIQSLGHQNQLSLSPVRHRRLGRSDVAMVGIRERNLNHRTLSIKGYPGQLGQRVESRSRSPDRFLVSKSKVKIATPENEAKVGRGMGEEE